MDKFWTMDSGVFRALDFTQPLPVWKVAIRKVSLRNNVSFQIVDGVLSPGSERTSFPGLGGGQPGLGAHQRSSGRRRSECRLAAGGGSFPSTVR